MHCLCLLDFSDCHPPKAGLEESSHGGICFSAAIEVSQVLLDRGLGEFDDVLHNTWGSLMGYCAAVILGYLFGQQKERYKGKVKGAGLFFGMTILMFTILILYNRPDWSMRLWRR